MKTALVCVGSLIVFSALSACARTIDPCSSIGKIGSDSAQVRALEDWVDKKLLSGGLDEKHAGKSRVTMPGDYSVQIDDPKLKSRLGGNAEARVILDTEGRVSSVFFGESNFQGLVVMARREKDFMLPSNQLTPITKRTSMICIRKD